MARCCVFGDSIAYGYCDSEGGWVDRLKRYFFSQDIDFAIYNQAISGDTTEDVLQRLRKECLSRKPDFIIFAMGTNDAQFLKKEQRMRTPKEQFRENLSSLVAIAKEFTSKVVFIGLITVDESKTSPIPWDTNKHYFLKNVKEYNEIVQAFCKEANILFIDVWDVLGNEELEDGLHPTTEGHKKLYEHIKKALLSSGSLD